MMVVLVAMLVMIMVVVEMQAIGAAPFHLGVHLLDGGVAYFEHFAADKQGVSS